MIKRLEKKFKSIEEENELSSYLEYFDVINQRSEREEAAEPIKTSNNQKPIGKENYFCNICQINFLKNEESLKIHLKSKV